MVLGAVTQDGGLGGLGYYLSPRGAPVGLGEGVKWGGRMGEMYRFQQRHEN